LLHFPNWVFIFIQLYITTDRNIPSFYFFHPQIIIPTEEGNLSSFPRHSQLKPRKPIIMWIDWR